MNKILLTLFAISIISYTTASEVPLCLLPSSENTKIGSHSKVEEVKDPGCAQVYTNASIAAKAAHSNIPLANTTTIPAQLSVGAVYLQPITMAPDGMMLPRNKSDIHLEMDIHAKANLKSRGFAPGDWLPNAYVTYSIQRIGSDTPLICGTTNSKPITTCQLMPMLASDGAHYGDNVKLDGPGFYVVTFDAHTKPMEFGWHTDTDSKILGTEYVDWKFKQGYVFKYTGIGKKGGY